MDPLRIPELVAGEVADAIPALLERTRAQLDLAQRLIGHLPCLSSSRAAPSSAPADPPARRSSGADSSHTGTTDRPRPTPAADRAADAPDPSVAVGDLAIPDYDSLAASQVVPRLASLDPAELALVLTYEQSHRSRQTILNRVRQLQAATNGS